MKTLRFLGVLGLALVAFGGCKKPAPAAPGPAPANSLDQPLRAEAGPAQGPYVLSPELLDRFLAYQKDMLEVYRGLASDVSAISAKADGGSSSVSPAVMHDAVHMLERRAQAEEVARKKANLSAHDVTQIEKMVGAVLSRRKLQETLPLDQTIAQFEALKAKLPKDQQAQVEQSIAELKAQKADAENLTEERKQFGEANVKLILSREKELGTEWDAWLSALTGGKAK